MDVVPLVVTGLLLHEISLDLAGCEDHNPCIPCTHDVLDPLLATKLNQLSTSDMILDPIFTDKEPCLLTTKTTIFLAVVFGVPAQITSTLWYARRITALELLCMYSITLPQIHLHITPQSHEMGDIL